MATKKEILKKQEMLKALNLSLYVRTRKEVFNELSDNQTMFCCCGRLATSLHERNCSKFNNKVEKETIKRLSYQLATDTNDY